MLRENWQKNSNLCFRALWLAYKRPKIVSEWFPQKIQRFSHIYLYMSRTIIRIAWKQNVLIIGSKKSLISEETTKSNQLLRGVIRLLLLHNTATDELDLLSYNRRPFFSNWIQNLSVLSIFFEPFNFNERTLNWNLPELCCLQPD